MLWTGDTKDQCPPVVSKQTRQVCPSCWNGAALRFYRAFIDAWKEMDVLQYQQKQEKKVRWNDTEVFPMLVL